MTGHSNVTTICQNIWRSNTTSKTRLVETILNSSALLMTAKCGSLMEQNSDDISIDIRRTRSSSVSTETVRKALSPNGNSIDMLWDITTERNRLNANSKIVVKGLLRVENSNHIKVVDINVVLHRRLWRKVIRRMKTRIRRRNRCKLEIYKRRILLNLTFSIFS